MENFTTESIPDPDIPQGEKRTAALRVVLDILETLILSVILFTVINAV